MGQAALPRRVTWLFIVWSIVPIVIAVVFSFNDGRSRTAWQGFSTRWFYGDPTQSVLDDPALRSAMSTRSAGGFAMLIATPLGVGWRSACSAGGVWAGRANFLMLFPLVTPEIVMAVACSSLFTQLFTPIGLGTPAQIIGQVTFSISYVVVIVRGRLASIGPEYEEAAADLGAPPREVLRRVLLPLLSPAIFRLPGRVRALDRRLRRHQLPGDRASTRRRCRSSSTRPRAERRRRR